LSGAQQFQLGWKQNEFVKKAAWFAVPPGHVGSRDAGVISRRTYQRTVDRYRRICACRSASFYSKWLPKSARSTQRATRVLQDDGRLCATTLMVFGTTLHDCRRTLFPYCAQSVFPALWILIGADARAASRHDCSFAQSGAGQKLGKW